MSAGPKPARLKLAYGWRGAPLESRLTCRDHTLCAITPRRRDRPPASCGRPRCRLRRRPRLRTPPADRHSTPAAAAPTHLRTGDPTKPPRRGLVDCGRQCRSCPLVPAGSVARAAVDRPVAGAGQPPGLRSANPARLTDVGAAAETSPHAAALVPALSRHRTTPAGHRNRQQPAATRARARGPAGHGPLPGGDNRAQPRAVPPQRVRRFRRAAADAGERTVPVSDVAGPALARPATKCHPA